jgi:hypothetical protein
MAESERGVESDEDSRHSHADNPLENVVFRLSNRLRQSELKRRRTLEQLQTLAPPPPPPPPPQPQPLSALNSLLFSGPNVRSRFSRSVTAVADKRLKLGDDAAKGRPLLSRMIAASFCVIQSVNPTQLGVGWAALLYICYHLLTNAYTDGPHTLQSTLESAGSNAVFNRDVMAEIVHELGMSPSLDADDDVVMKAARVWARMDSDAHVDAINEAWDLVANNSQVRFALTSVVWPCHRAHLLFRPLA